MPDAQELGLDDLRGLYNPDMCLTSDTARTDHELQLSSSSATVFLNYVLSGGGGHIDPGVADAISATTEALRDVGMSWEELLSALRCGRWEENVHLRLEKKYT